MESCSSFVKHISDLNEAAVCHLQGGNNMGAIVEFQKALTAFREQMQRNLEECSFPSPLSSQGDGTYKSLDIAAEPMGGGLCCCFPNPEANTEGYLFQFYCRVFSLSNPEHFVPSPRNKNLLLATILYNLASAHHREGISSGGRGYYDTALQLYGLAFATIEKVADAQSAADRTFLVLLCALYNNMGYIHDYLSDWDKSKLCLEWMQVVLRESSVSVLNREEYLFFSGYLVVSADKHFTLAPAA